ncbi:AGAP007239-PA-like protein [Anopheles sinensis]|uniref:AGAP007239-PA-like protein n=1 Tax=Anopheles sinensis TaxID=74873 RepID=A0A084VQX2_ANOSI|nr:AGAP007239-PA-like protein [Anopheles sinensis]
MEMQEMTTFQLPDEIVQPFAISCAGDMFVVSCKDETFVLRLKYKQFSEDGAINYVLSRFKCSTARPTGQLLAHETNLYNASDIEQRKIIMLDQTLAPNIAKVYINNVQSWISPPGAIQDSANGYLIANLTNMGQLTIYRQDDQWLSSWNMYVDVSAAWIKHIYKGEAVEQFDQLQTMAYEILITCFCWQDAANGSFSPYFAFGTKSGKIVICSLSEAGPQIEEVYQHEEATFVLKYNSEKNFLLACGRSGRVTLFRCNKNIRCVGTFFDEDLTASCVEYELESVNDHLLLLIVKGSFILALQTNLNGKILGTGVLNLEHFMITGLQQLDKGKYIACTMEGAIFLIIIDRTHNGELKILCEQIQTDINVTSYALYGVTATRTRTCWLFLGFPSRRYDHLSLRSPTCVFFTKFARRQALDVLQSNQTLKMTDYYDAAEVMRYNMSKNPDTFNQLDLVVLQPELDTAFCYHLKLQLIYLGAKMTHQSRRNKLTTEILHNQLQFLCTMIEVINAANVLCYLAEIARCKSTLNPLQQTAVLCLRNFIHNIVEDAFPGDYEYVHLGLKAKLSKVLHQTATLPTTPYEICNFCDAEMAPGRTACRKDHPVFRCVTTKIQIPLDGDEITCEMCQRYSLKLSMLSLVFEDQKLWSLKCPIDYRNCCVCDVPFRSTS